MPASPSNLRLREVQRVRRLLETASSPRLQMLLLVGLTGAVGFLASVLLLHIGLTTMWLRYLLSFACAYLVFLGLLWLWLRTQVEDYADAADLPDLGGSRTDLHACRSDGAAHTVESATAPAEPHPVGEALEAAAQAEELAIPLILLIIVAALLCAVFFIVYGAPLLFAELLVDGVLSAKLYRKLRGLEPEHWLQTALRRTALPFAASALILSAAPGA